MNEQINFTLQIILKIQYLILHVSDSANYCISVQQVIRECKQDFSQSREYSAEIRKKNNFDNPAILYEIALHYAVKIYCRLLTVHI